MNPGKNESNELKELILSGYAEIDLGIVDYNKNSVRDIFYEINNKFLLHSIKNRTTLFVLDIEGLPVTEQARQIVRRFVLSLEYGESYNILLPADNNTGDLRTALIEPIRFAKMFSPFCKYSVKWGKSITTVKASSKDIANCGYRDLIESLGVGDTEKIHCVSISRKRLYSMLHTFAFFVGIKITIKTLPDKNYLITRTN